MRGGSADCRDRILAADIRLVLGRALSWAGEPQRGYDELTQAAATVRRLDPARTAALLAEATLPAAIAGHIRLMNQVAAQSESVGCNAVPGRGSSAEDGTAKPGILAMIAEAYVLSGSFGAAGRPLE